MKECNAGSARTLNLSHPDPCSLVAAFEARDLARAIHTLDQWSKQTLETADLLFLCWSARACARQGDSEEIGEVQRALTKALSQSRAAETLPADYQARWKAYGDMLEACRLRLSQADFHGMLRRKHVPEILQMLSDRKSVRQSEMLELLRLDITAERLYRLMSLLESHGLIFRRRSGQDHLVMLNSTA